MTSLAETQFVNYKIIIENQVARILLVRQGIMAAIQAGRAPADPHWELFEIMNALRVDNTVRVVVIEGEEDGQFFEPMTLGDSTEFFKQSSEDIWKASTGIVRMHEAMAELDRPIIAKVNGDAVSLGASIVFAADLIVAREDARIVDNHLGMGEVLPALTTHGALPGDGCVALVPLHMSPARAKEFLFLARTDIAADLAARGVINYAVPASELDSLVDSLVARLLARPSYALAWTKRIANKHIVEQLHRTLDAGAAYEMINIYQLVDEAGGKFTL